MRISSRLIETLAKGWHNIDAYPPGSWEGKYLHAKSTIEALENAGYAVFTTPEGLDLAGHPIPEVPRKTVRSTKRRKPPLRTGR